MDLSVVHTTATSCLRSSHQSTASTADSGRTRRHPGGISDGYGWLRAGLVRAFDTTLTRPQGNYGCVEAALTLTQIIRRERKKEDGRAALAARPTIAAARLTRAEMKRKKSSRVSSASGDGRARMSVRSPRRPNPTYVFGTPEALAGLLGSKLPFCVRPLRFPRPATGNRLRVTGKPRRLFGTQVEYNSFEKVLVPGLRRPYASSEARISRSLSCLAIARQNWEGE